MPADAALRSSVFTSLARAGLSKSSASESLRTGTATRADCPKTFQPISPIEIRQREHAEPDDLPDDVHVRE
jgi:hypothetical protein